MAETITSTSNSKIKLVRALQGRSRHRQKEKAFVAEGVRLLEEAWAINWPTRFILFDDSLSERGKALLEEFITPSGVETARVTPSLMAEISDTETPQGILAVLEMKPIPIPPNPTFVIIVDQIRNPGNLGTLLRTSEATGADAVLLTPGTVDAFSPKVIRSGMGAHFHLPIQALDGQAIQTYLADLTVYLADASSGTPLWQADLVQPCALLIGGEAFGASAMGEMLSAQRVTIPMAGRVESLNAAIAGGILMAEVLRQRYQNHKD